MISSLLIDRSSLRNSEVLQGSARFQVAFCALNHLHQSRSNYLLLEALGKVRRISCMIFFGKPRSLTSFARAHPCSQGTLATPVLFIP